MSARSGDDRPGRAGRSSTGRRPAWVLLYTRRFDDVAHVVALVRSRLLLGSAVALIVALIGGYLVARALTRRVQRLDDAARDIAAGKQVDPLPVDSGDELGRLTQTFNDMQRQLGRVESARREFIANASHELRTPIFSLGGFVELLQDEKLDPETREEFLQAMGEQVGAPAEARRGPARPLAARCRLARAARRARRPRRARGCRRRRVRTGGRDLHNSSFELARSGDVLARCDRERVAQIMRILLDNALRHTPEGTPVKVSIERNNGSAEFAVTDRGPGVDETLRLQLFERFYTGDAARGSGLGLAIAKELAERMDGRISLVSRPGKTIFTLALPVAAEDGHA